MQIILKNFQSHHYTELEIGPGVTAILGDNDSGKTAVVRALRWLLWNRPSGDSFRSHWGGTTEVSLKIPERGTLSRIKDKTVNLYRINDSELKAFGNNVPEEVSQFLPINYINFQFQTDPPFFLSLSSGERANLLQKVTKLDILSKANSWILKQIRNLHNSAKGLDLKIIQLEEELSRIPNLVEIQQDIQELKNQENRAEELSNSIQSLTEIIEDINKIEVELGKLKPYMILRNEINELLKLHQDMKVKQGKLQKLQESISSILAIQSQLDTLNKELEKARKEWNERMPEICPLCGQKFPKKTRSR